MQNLIEIEKETNCNSSESINANDFFDINLALQVFILLELFASLRQ